MAKSASTKPLGSSSSSSKATKKDKSTKPTPTAEPKEKKEAAPAKSLKRKSDAAEAKPSTTIEESVKPSSYKKSKTTLAAPSPEKSKPSAKPKAEPKKQQKKVADKTKIPVSRRKQRDPKPMKGTEESDEEEEEQDVEEEEEEPAKATEDKKGKAPKATVQEESDEDDEEEVELHGFSTDEDSSDEESDMEVDASAFDVGKLPTIAKDDATVKKKLEKAKRNPTGERGVLFLGRIPHGFYEEQMKSYFTQFGDVTRVRLSRNKKTGKSKHYGFIEFDSASVAKIVAETMDNYLLNGHIMQCKVIPKDKVHPQLWVGANRKWRTVPPEQLTRAKHNKKRDDDEQYAAGRRLIKRQNQRKRKLEELGINYNFEGAGYKKIPKNAESPA